MLVSSWVQYMHDFTWLFLLLLSHSVHPLWHAQKCFVNVSVYVYVVYFKDVWLVVVWSSCFNAWSSDFARKFNRAIIRAPTWLVMQNAGERHSSRLFLATGGVSLWGKRSVITAWAGASVGDLCSYVTPSLICVLLFYFPQHACVCFSLFKACWFLFKQSACSDSFMRTTTIVASSFYLCL